jgi:hypothetical protein
LLLFPTWFFFCIFRCHAHCTASTRILR